MATVIDILEERGFVEQKTHEAELNDYIENGNVSCYIGFDPTASSLHIGSLVPIMALAHMQRSGHRPIALVGGGTGLVGDPSGKTEMRQMLTVDIVNDNVKCLKAQLSRFIDFENGKALLVNNADWLSDLKYIPFLRDIGRHFSVNRMIKMESCKLRLDSEEGLSFIEFNYMLLQAYDFMILSRDYGCRVQMGGSDQWGNIVAGIDLIRRVTKEQAFGVTFPLITTSSGAKMGKTAAGAVWLDPERTSPYDYYQYWVNSDDADVARFLALYTFLPMAEIRAVASLKDADLNFAKSVLAFETTQLVHGREEAEKAYYAAMKMFGSRTVPHQVLSSSSIPRSTLDGGMDSIPQTLIDRMDLEKGIPAFRLFQIAGLAETSGAARRLISQGGAYVNDTRVDSMDQTITDKDLNGLEMVLRAGKKRYHKIMVNSKKKP
ncbi:MAG: tyrosine--tRNA ligase [Desulfobacteraceae bacterium]|nr:tyrosine--tRNA ligase [Desulfobacteraceae bacterium]MBU4000865.1 tyrosine--tRNA ligase [Pseudomonadota bacterium]MBU4053792.1 tyrosine--tRNA ligase [Pseudomonadota bacterium]